MSEKIVLKDSLGYFDNDKKEYVIENMYPVRPLMNFLWSDKMVCQTDHRGFGGQTFAGFTGYRRFMETGERIIYIKDRETGEIFSPNMNYKKENFDEYRSLVGIGYQKVLSSYKGIKTEYTISLPNDDFAVQFGLKFKNLSNRPRKLSVYYALRTFNLLVDHAASGFADKDEKYGGLWFSHKSFECPTEYGELYFATDKPFDAYAVYINDIIGTYGTWTDPEFIKADKLPSRGYTIENVYHVGVQYDIDLEADEEFPVNFALAIGKDMDEAAKIAVKYATAQAQETAITEEKAQYDNVFDVYTANIPDKYIETLINIWLKRQVSLGKSWGRVYGKGFRDVMQDITAFASFDVNKAKERIFLALSNQYSNGNPIRMFDPDYKALYNDGATWIPDAVTAYIKESGDYGILDEVVPYRDGGEDTVLNHIINGMNYLATDVGQRGLTLFRRGDWNDSTNGAGNLGIGESVWTSTATVRALKQFAALLDKIGKNELKEDMLARAEKMTENILKHGLYNGHFIHGFDDWGNIVGGGEDEEEASLCLNPQTWAVLADIGDKELQTKVMDLVEERLKCRFGYVLNNPPYTTPKKGVGRTSYFKPGLIENASVYIHASMFKSVADCLLGRGDNAYNTLCSVNYRNNPTSGMEPYAISNMLIGPDNPYRCGDAPYSWISGSAGWMYRSFTEFVLGIRADYDGIRIIPNAPSDWTEYSITRKYRNATYKINFKKTGTFSLTVNGEKTEGNLIPVFAPGTITNVEVTY